MIDSIESVDIAFHHTVFCQTALPYRRSADRVMERSNGSIRLRIEAGTVLDPISQKWIDVSLPYGVKSRLIMMHFDTLAIVNQSPEFEIDLSMTAFLKRLQGYSPNGKELKDFRQHALALTASLFRFAVSDGTKTLQTDTKVISTFDLWSHRQDLWTSKVKMSDEYFQTLKGHAVPLDYKAVVALKESALSLDIYKWLAQRLCRLSAAKAAFVSWPSLQLQFGHSYARQRDFKSAFLIALGHVQNYYEGAQKGVNVDGFGVTLKLAKPPVERLKDAIL